MNSGVKRHHTVLNIHGVFPGHCQKNGRIKMVNVSKEGQVFRCDICGNVVVVKEVGGGELVCCGEPMILESA